MNTQLLKSQRNDVFEIIKAKGLQPSEFEWSSLDGPTSGAGEVPRLTHVPSKYFFNFDNNGHGSFVSSWSPGRYTHEQKGRPSIWTGVLKYVAIWLDNIKREWDAPDLWDSVSQEQELINATSASDDNTPFTSEQKEYIRRGVNEIKEYIIVTHHLEGEQRAAIEDRLQYLLESSERVGRKDWKNLALSVFFSIVIYLALPQSAAGELFRFVAATLHRVLGEGKFLP